MHQQFEADQPGAPFMEELQSVTYPKEQGKLLHKKVKEAFALTETKKRALLSDPPRIDRYGSSSDKAPHTSVQ